MLRPLMVCLVACGVWAVSGCSLGPIDRSIRGLIKDESGRMNAVPVRDRQWGSPDQYGRTPDQYETDLETNNPPASALDYTAADPNRDPSKMLAEFVSEAITPREGGSIQYLTLADVWRISQTSGYDYLSAEEDYIFAAIALLIERHLWGPRFFDDVRASVDGGLEDGDHQAAVSVVNDLRVTKRLPYGGSVEAAWIWRATEQLREQATGQYTQSSSLVFSGAIPLLRGAGQVARESRIQAERDLVYSARAFERRRRELFVDTARDYFDLLEQQAQISNQKLSLESVYIQLLQEQDLFDKQRKSVVDVNNIENTFLTTKSTLDNLRDQYITQLDRFKISLGIPIEQHIDVVPLAFDLSEPDITLQEATARALALRLDLQTRRDRIDDERRNLAIARNDLLPDLDLDANLTVPTDPDDDVGGVGFDQDELDYSVGVTFGLPLDRRQERLRLRQAVIRLERAMRDLDEFEDNVIIDARSTRRFIERARANLLLAEERVRITEQRKEAQDAQQDKFTTQERLDTENELIDAKTDRDNAETDLRVAILDYLLATGQLRVDRNGQLEPIPGMEFPPARIFADVGNLEKWYEDPPLEEIEQRIMEGEEIDNPETGQPVEPLDPDDAPPPGDGEPGNDDPPGNDDAPGDDDPPG